MSDNELPYFMFTKIPEIAERVKTPVREHDTDAGFDVYSAEEDSVIILPNDKMVIRTGIKIAFSPGYYIRCASKSGLSVKSDLETGAGVIDSGYRNEVKVVLRNYGNEPYKVTPGQKVCQLIMTRIGTPEIQEINETEYSEFTSSRGEGGFGSTGLN